MATDGLAGPVAIDNDGDLSLSPVLELNQSGAGTTVIGGREADSKLWQASLYPETEKELCSATMIGPQVLLLAAHCVGDKKKVSWRSQSGPDYGGTCTRSSLYGEKPPKDPSADYALCLINPAPVIDKSETINEAESLIKDGAEIVLTGYGCTRLTDSGGNDGVVFRVTKPVKIDVSPGEPGGERNTILIQNDTTATCPGDSGSGAYVYVAPDKRVIAAVNSRAISDDHLSFLSSLTTPDAKAFLQKWVADNQQEKICGYNYFDDGKCQ